MSGILGMLLGAGIIPLAVVTQPANVSGTAAAGAPSGPVATNLATVVVRGGTQNYTYQWNFVGAPPAGVTFTNPNGASTEVAGATVPAGGTQSGQMYCSISDGVHTVNSGQSTWSLKNTSFAPLQHLYTGAGAFLETVPVGATHVEVEIISAGGGGEGGSFQAGNHQSFGGQGGDSGTYCRSVYNVVGGQTLNGFLGLPGNGGAGGNFGAPSAGGTSTVSSGSLVIATMTAPGGNTGNPASGGNQANVGPNAGTTGAQNVIGQGGASQNGDKIAGYGAGGNGGLGVGNGQNGAGGAISFYYT